jgi:hypothetical protein
MPLICANPDETAHGLQPAERVRGVHKDTRIIQPRNKKATQVLIGLILAECLSLQGLAISAPTPVGV